MSGWEDLISAELSPPLFPSSPHPSPAAGLHCNLEPVSSEPETQQTAEQFANTFGSLSISTAASSSCQATLSLPFSASPYLGLLHLKHPRRLLGVSPPSKQKQNKKKPHQNQKPSRQGKSQPYPRETTLDLLGVLFIIYIHQFVQARGGLPSSR